MTGTSLPDLVAAALAEDPLKTYAVWQIKDRSTVTIDMREVESVHVFRRRLAYGGWRDCTRVSTKSGQQFELMESGDRVAKDWRASVMGGVVPEL